MDEKLFNVGLYKKCQESDLQNIQIVLRQETELCLRSNSIFSFKKLCLNKILTENCSSLCNDYALEPDPPKPLHFFIQRALHHNGRKVKSLLSSADHTCK